MKRPHSLIASSSSSSSSSNNYEVFLSFRGETRNNFTSHLCEALRQKRIHTFLDDDKLQRGKPISSELLRAIEGSRCSVVILSSDYASSRWCLDELVKILQCMKDAGQIVRPLFYHVDPSHVRNQTGSIGDAFQTHEQNSPAEKVQTWRSALRQVGNLAGSHLNGDRNEADFIKDFVKEVSSRLIPRSKISEHLVGMDSRLRKLSECVSESSFIGICGMGGMGKTTLARAYFEAMSDQYEAHSFLANVRECCGSGDEGLVKLQNQLLKDILKDELGVSNVYDGKTTISSRLCCTRVLVILDDVEHRQQIQGLAERKDWFGDGSRIILTTRDGSLLTQAYEEKEYVIYEVDKLEKSEAQQLFSGIAFKGYCPKEDYEQFSNEFIEYANGLPLALEVLGYHLRGKTLNEWESAWDRLKEDPNREIMNALLISFYGLEETEKNIFLDIACFFNGHKKSYVTEIMDSCGFHGEIGIRTLLDKSLLHKNRDNILRMHDLLQQMGRKIATGKLGNEPGRKIATGKLGNEQRRRSRILYEDDFKHVINSDTEIEEVEAMAGCPDIALEDLLKALSKMRKLRLLIIHYSVGRWSSCPAVGRWSSFPDLSNELRHLHWDGVPFNYFPPIFQPQGLVESQLSYRQIEPMKPFWHLKYINLADSPHICKLEDFSSFPNLEKLILDCCKNLKEIHPSIAGIRSLTLLSLRSCRSLKSLPTSMHGLKSLKVLNLDGCRSLGNLPEDFGCLSKLEKLNLSNIAIKDVAYSISGLKALKKLKLCQCDLRDGAIPDEFGWLVSLEHLDLSWNDFSCLPACINRLSKLRYLYLRHCKELRSLDQELPDSIEMVRVDGCISLHTFLDPLKPCNLRFSAICCGCTKLVKRQGSKRTAVTSLGRHLQKPSIRQSKRFDIVLPAGDDEIPSWFTDPSRGSSSISLSLHPNWCNNDWIGFALCACSPCETFSADTWWQIKINDQDWGFEHVEGPVDYPFEEGRRLWILYLPRDEYFRTEWQKFEGQIEFSLRRRRIKLEGDDNIIIGARLVYKQDIEELNQTAPHESLDRLEPSPWTSWKPSYPFQDDDTDADDDDMDADDDDTDADDDDTMTADRPRRSARALKPNPKYLGKEWT